MNFRKKTCTFALILSLLLIETCAVAGATEISTSPELPQAYTEQTVSPQAEETVWYTRVHNGKHQKRLWSITNQCWLTDWIDIG